MENMVNPREPTTLGQQSCPITLIAWQQPCPSLHSDSQQLEGWPSSFNLTARLRVVEDGLESDLESATYGTNVVITKATRI
ncbi:hypothetical protein CR513_28292, partial [Mucuna pruriens]